MSIAFSCTVKNKGITLEQKHMPHSLAACTNQSLVTPDTTTTVKVYRLLSITSLL